MDNRTEFIKARVTPDERVRAEQTAALLNLSMSDMIRVLVLDCAPDPTGLSADDRNSLNLILRYLQDMRGRDITPVLGSLAALIERIEAQLD